MGYARCSPEGRGRAPTLSALRWVSLVMLRRAGGHFVAGLAGVFGVSRRDGCRVVERAGTTVLGRPALRHAPVDVLMRATVQHAVVGVLGRVTVDAVVVA